MDRRVVVTGVGIISPLGLSADEHFKALLSGACGIGPVSLFEVKDFPARFAAEVKDFKANKFIKNRKSIKIMARDIQLAVAAASLAAADAGIYDGVEDGTRLGVSMGAGLIPSELDELGAAVAVSMDDKGRLDLKKYGREGLANLFPLWLLKYLPNMLNSHISIEYDARGPNNCITSGNASGLLAVGEAARVIERGHADVMLAGGAESRVHPLSMARLYVHGILSTAPDLPQRGPRPFCPDRSGLVAGEAGVVVVLEEAQRARGRGARIYCEFAGFGSSCGAQITEELDADGGAAVDSMVRAIAESALDEGSIDAVFANASGLPEDAVEASVIASVLGEGTQVSALRAAAGHTMAASGALDFATACMALSQGVLPGTFGADSAGDLPIELASRPREGKLNALAVNAFSFGGQTSSAVVREYTDG